MVYRGILVRRWNQKYEYGDNTQARWERYTARTRSPSLYAPEVEKTFFCNTDGTPLKT